MLKRHAPYNRGPIRFALRRRALLGALFFGVSISAQATEISTLLEGVRHHYEAQMGTLQIEAAQSALEMVHAQFYPKIRLFGSYSHYNAPSNLRPVTPSENAQSAPNLPF